MPEMPPPPDAALAGALRDLSWTIHRLVPEMAGLERLPTTELAVLMHVLEHPGTTVTEVARDLGLQPSNTSAAVRGLVERDLLARDGDPADRRVTRLAPTAKARAEQEHIDSAWSGTVRTAMADLDPGQVAAIEAAAEALAALDRVLRSRRTRPHP